jgi:hypothetical protein
MDNWDLLILDGERSENKNRHADGPCDDMSANGLPTSEHSISGSDLVEYRA